MRRSSSRSETVYRPVEGVEDHGRHFAVRTVDQLPGHTVAQAAPVDQSPQAAVLPATYPVAHGAGMAAGQIQITVTHPTVVLAFEAEELGHCQATVCFREAEAWAEGVGVRRGGRARGARRGIRSGSPGRPPADLG